MAGDAGSYLGYKTALTPVYQEACQVLAAEQQEEQGNGQQGMPVLQPIGQKGHGGEGGRLGIDLYN